VSAGISPRDVTLGDLARTLPELDKGLVLYLSQDDLSRAVVNLRRLAQQ
jgi:hypothetical protein